MLNQFISILFFIGIWYQINGKEDWLEFIINNNVENSSDEFFETTSTSQIWAVLVAGSNGWYNYRHQADVSHAYHVLKKHGINENNIITMMYDDIAHDKLYVLNY